MNARVDLVDDEHTEQIAKARHVAEQQNELDVGPPAFEVPEVANDGSDDEEDHHHRQDVAHHRVALDTLEVVSKEGGESMHSWLPQVALRAMLSP
jgi:hypothetical protein